MRLIDADALKESLTETLKRCDEWIENAKDAEIRTVAESNYTAFLESILRVKDAPTIDAEPVVRCKDCKWCEGYGYACVCHNPRYGDGYANYQPPHIDDEYWCADGERKDDE